MSITVSDTWKEWIQTNIDAGCTVDSMLEAMHNSGFSYEVAMTSILSIRANGLVIPVLSLDSEDVHDYSNPIFNHTCSVIHTSDRDVKVVMSSNKPIVRLLEDFMSHEECDKLIELAQPKMQPSKVVTSSGSHDFHEARTSSGAYFSLQENHFISMLDKRISEVMNWPVENGEGIQVLNYQVGQEYKAHYDYFADMSTVVGNQRSATLVMYLNDVEEGGSTSFPEVGITAYPKKGSALYFEYLDDAGHLDKSTLHSGDPVIKGEKWIATKWTRAKESDCGCKK